MNMGRGPNGRALIVDNSEEVLLSLEKLLGNAGFDTRTTWSGHEALALMQSKPFDVLLVDDYLPDLHIAEFLKKVKLQARKPAVIVMIKGRPQPADLRRFKSLGVDTIVDKMDPEQVRRALPAGVRTEAVPRAHLN
jgi:CheY-like chemotaxis protein